MSSQILLAWIANAILTHTHPFAVWAQTMLAFVVASTVVIVVVRPRQRLKFLLATLLATTAAALAIIGLRRIGNYLDLLGSLPANLEWYGIGLLAIVTLVVCCFVVVVSSPISRLRWARLPISFAITIAAGLTSYALTQTPFLIPNSPTKILNEIVRLEANRNGLQEFDAQSLSFYLTAVGRESEAHQYVEQDVNLPIEGVNSEGFQANEWRKQILEIAKRERIVIIMEDHHTPLQREWIQQTLGIFRDAGFDHYAAEGIGEWSTSLMRRGFPVWSTGFYTGDPSFGNLLRCVHALGFKIHEYDVARPDPGQREEGQATALARIFASSSDCKLLIHSGPGHAEKFARSGVDEAMAARLWNMTGVEPYCILQSSPPSVSPNNIANYQKMIESAQVETESKMISPLPDWLLEYGLHRNAYDAYVVHPSASDWDAAKLNRQPLAGNELIEISIVWKHSTDVEYPIVIGVYDNDEPANAVAIDQLMIRKSDVENGTVRFELWSTQETYKIRAHSVSGSLDIAVERSDNETDIVIRLR
jgi:hypothetical protein